MAEPSWPAEVELSAYLTDMESVQQKLRVAPPLVVLTADLLKRVPRRVAVRNASELIAALIVEGGNKSPSALETTLSTYREARAHDVLDTEATSGAFELPARSELDLM